MKNWFLIITAIFIAGESHAEGFKELAAVEIEHVSSMSRYDTPLACRMDTRGEVRCPEAHTYRIVKANVFCGEKLQPGSLITLKQKIGRWHIPSSCGILSHPRPRHGALKCVREPVFRPGRHAILVQQFHGPNLATGTPGNLIDYSCQ